MLEVKQEDFITKDEVTVQTIVKIDEILKNIFVDKLRQDAKSG